jgi:hypothetical protein
MFRGCRIVDGGFLSKKELLLKKEAKLLLLVARTGDAAFAVWWGRSEKYLVLFS